MNVASLLFGRASSHDLFCSYWAIVLAAWMEGSLTRACPSSYLQIVVQARRQRQQGAAVPAATCASGEAAGPRAASNQLSSSSSSSGSNNSQRQQQRPGGQTCKMMLFLHVPWCKAPSLSLRACLRLIQKPRPSVPLTCTHQKELRMAFLRHSIAAHGLFQPVCTVNSPQSTPAQSHEAGKPVPLHRS